MNIIVTGASRGIGYELVKQFSADPANKIVAIARNKKALTKLKEECKKVNRSSSIFIVEADLSDLDSIGSLAKDIIKEIKHVDVLINNAGALVNKPFAATTITELENIYRVNVFSIYKLIQELFPHFNKKQRTHVVNISSMGGVQGSVKFSGLSAYSSSKAALIGLTECLAEEFKTKNITVNCLALGSVQTEMFAQAFPNYKAKTSAKDMAKFIATFALTGHQNFNGKILPVSVSTT